jgi:hypothetical protein
MASTRTRNTPGDYASEQRINNHHNDYMSFEKSSFYGTVPQACFPGNGLIGMKTPGLNLSANSCDIESQLFGIGSTNLVSPQIPIAPDLYALKSLNVAYKAPVILPETFVPTENQRALPRN